MFDLWNHLWGKLLMTFLLSMVPILELRGAIPIGVAHGLDFRIAMIASIIGNLLPIPFIIVFVRKIFAFMRQMHPRLDTLVSKLENRANLKSDVVRKYEFWGLVIFVGIPLPGTGAWTGALIAAMLDLRLKKAFPAITLGVILASCIISFVTYGVGSLLL